MYFQGHQTALLNLDQFLEIGPLLELKTKLDFAIATSINRKYYSYLPGTDHYIDLEPNYMDWTKAYEKLAEKMPELRDLNHNERATFTLLNQDCISFSEFIEVYNNGKFCIEDKFNPIFDWLQKQNVFESLKSCFVFLNSEGKASLKHIDTNPNASQRQLLWISMDKRKKFFIEIDGVRQYADGHCISFIPNVPHGTEPDLRMNYSIRFEGIFSSSFKEKTNLSRHFQ